MQYRTVWRWHFYASLFCMPFVIVLSLTGAIYLFKPQLDRYRDRAYDGVVSGQSSSLPSEQIQAALREYPQAIPTAYELRTASTDAVRIVLQNGSERFASLRRPAIIEGAWLATGRRWASAFGPHDSRPVGHGRARFELSRTGQQLDDDHDPDWSLLVVAQIQSAGRCTLSTHAARAQAVLARLA